ncbi:MAG TPA: cytochrome c oxidase assembly protein [Alphaproteobacteria bacterium]|nr:cytochrome c oxidase assembly protein [Alphaproteobacteria bacterium]
MAGTPNRNLRTGLVLSALVVAMVALAFASVPLYRLFCQVTGFGGTPQRVEANAVPVQTIADRVVTIRFNADVNSGLPWSFQPAQPSLRVRVGEQALAFYRATNHSDRPVTGVATFNVTPDKAGAYFSKIACFCFTEQTLSPGQSVEMPVTFFVDPAILQDRGLDDVDTITLSYTFFRASEEAEVGAAPAAGANGTGG